MSWQSKSIAELLMVGPYVDWQHFLHQQKWSSSLISWHRSLSADHGLYCTMMGLMVHSAVRLACLQLAASCRRKTQSPPGSA
jgi:hypothetical protein